MSEPLPRLRVVRIAIVLAALFDLLALLVFLHGTPIVFTAFMFVGQPVVVAVLILLVGAVVADLRAKQLL
jgi:hypothetical protein